MDVIQFINVMRHKKVVSDRVCKRYKTNIGVLVLIAELFELFCNNIKSVVCA